MIFTAVLLTDASVRYVTIRLHISIYEYEWLSVCMYVAENRNRRLISWWPVGFFHIFFIM